MKTHATNTSRPRRRHAPRSRRGFSLSEVLIASTVLALLMAGVLQFKLESVRSMFISEEKADINKDIRMLTAELSSNAREAKFFAMYPSYNASDRDTAAKRCTQADSGDLMVLVFYGTAPDPIKFNVRPVTRIVGYYRAPYQTGEAVPNGAQAGQLPVRKFDLSVTNGGIPANSYLQASNLPSGGTYRTLESLLPADSSSVIKSHDIVVQLAEGLADGKLFYNFWDKSVMVNGKIVHGNAAKQVTDTYNFTVSPRG